MRSALLALSLLLATAAPASAAPRSETDHEGPVRATLTFDETEQDEGFSTFGDMRLRVERDGAVVHDAPVAPRGCEGGDACRPAFALVDERSLDVRDLDGDADPEVLVQVYTGGAHCCLIAYVVDGTTVVSKDFGDPAFRLAELGGAAGPEFVSGDPRFAYAFGPYASSRWPEVILRLRDGRFVDVTRQFPQRIVRDARGHLRHFTRLVRTGDAEHGTATLAAWAADRYRLGLRRATLRRLRREVRRHRLPSSAGQIDRRLRAWGYAR